MHICFTVQYLTSNISGINDLNTLYMKIYTFLFHAPYITAVVINLFKSHINITAIQLKGYVTDTFLGKKLTYMLSLIIR